MTARHYAAAGVGDGHARTLQVRDLPGPAEQRGPVVVDQRGYYRRVERDRLTFGLEGCGAFRVQRLHLARTRLGLVDRLAPRAARETVLDDNRAKRVASQHRQQDRQ